MRRTIRAGVLSAVIAIGATTVAIPAAQAQDDHHRQQEAAGDRQAVREAHEGQHAQDLRTILRLRPDQEPALAAFLQSHKPAMKPPENRGSSGQAGIQTTPQRLDEMARREAQRAAMNQRHAEAVRAFYAALSSDQRQVFDALQRMHGGDERKRGDHHGVGAVGRGPMDGRPPGTPMPRD